jgi:4-hydroxy 2-oxovalerate aldolase
VSARLQIFDASMRDGSHTIRHQLRLEDIRVVAAALDRAGVDAIGIGHGEGLGASSLHFGKAAHTDVEMIEAAAESVESAVVTVTLIPGVGVRSHLRDAWESGARRARIATHATEADISLQHIALARELGFQVHGDLMMPHLTSAAEFAEQATMMVDAGAENVHVIDSAGTLMPTGVKERIDAFLDAFGDRAGAGIHAHDNIGLAVANTLAAAEAGATFADGCLAGLGAGAGNARLEQVAVAMERSGMETRLDVLALQDAAAYVVENIAPPSWPQYDELSLILGSAGVPATFRLHVERAAERFGVDPRVLIVELGREKTVSGQEDLILRVAGRLADERPPAVQSSGG